MKRWQLDSMKRVTQLPHQPEPELNPSRLGTAAVLGMSTTGSTWTPYAEPMDPVTREAKRALRASLDRHGFGSEIVQSVTRKILKTLQPLPKDQQRRLLRELEVWNARGADLDRLPSTLKQAMALADLEEEQRVKRAHFEELAGVEFDEFRARVRRLAADAPIPPLTSALNVEAATMGWSHVVWGAVPGYDVDSPLSAEMQALIGVFDEAKDPAIVRVRRALAEIKARFVSVAAEDYLRFAFYWRESAYARLEVGHKLAAALCCTDVPDDLYVQHPWAAWSLVVPDGLLGELARVWLVARDPIVVLPVDRCGQHLTNLEPEAQRMVTALVSGCALAMSNPDDFRKDRQHRPTARSSKHRRTEGAPDLAQARFLLSTPVTVDLRDHVQAALSGKSRRGASPTVQFLVRGHWRQQAHGAGRALRKTIWVSPFWKGPEETRVLLRAHSVKD